MAELVKLETILVLCPISRDPACLLFDLMKLTKILFLLLYILKSISHNNYGEENANPSLYDVVRFLKRLQNVLF